VRFIERRGASNLARLVGKLKNNFTSIIMLIRFAANTQTGNLSNAAENNYATRILTSKGGKLRWSRGISFLLGLRHGAGS
jgi:hypothetical protein